MDGKGILRSETHLTTEYRPETPVVRGEEVDRVAENPEADIMNALFEEVEQRESPSLYEVYQAGSV